MKKELIKTGFNYDDVISFGNMFLLGNGRYGYRGTLEEFTKEEMTGLNVLGFYDRYEDKWRESINLPNPFHFVAYVNDEEVSILTKKPIKHEIKLDIYSGVFYRYSEFNDIIIKSERFISSVNKDLLCHRYVIIPKKEGLNIKIKMNNDLDIYEIVKAIDPTFSDKYLGAGAIRNGFYYDEKTVVFT